MISFLAKKQIWVLKYLPVIFLIGTAFLFHLLTLFSGHDWGGDFAQYIAQARNIATGKPFGESGYIYNPDNPIAPITYPPVFSLLLVPVYMYFGLNLYAMKMVILLAVMFLLIAFYGFCSGRLTSPLSRLGAVGLVAFSPWIWDVHHKINSEILFMAFLYASLFLIDKLEREDKDETRRLVLAIITGGVIYLACGTRSVGILLIPALIASNLLRMRRIDRTTVIATLVFGGFYLAQNIFFHADKSYMAYSPFHLENFFPNLEGYYVTMRGYWGEGFTIPARKATLLITGLLATAGFLASFRRKCSTAEIYLLLYLGVIFSYDAMVGVRYLLPVIPLYIMYVFCGIEAFPNIRGTQYKKYLAMGLLCRSEEHTSELQSH